jgi:hypothetical protein
VAYIYIMTRQDPHPGLRFAIAGVNAPAFYL